MASRLNPMQLIRGVREGLRHREENAAAEKPDWTTRIVLLSIPILVAGGMIWFGLGVQSPDQLLAGAALLAGALLTGFSQVAAWRERILMRDEQARTRALDEAAAHILLSLVAGVAITVLVVSLVVIPSEDIPAWVEQIRVVLGAISVAVLSYVGLTLLIVANLLWDAFQFEKQDAERENLEDLPNED
ncbi:hypothetical protein GCM10017711_24360 [Paeniglutamicibacter sulfureus]